MGSYRSGPPRRLRIRCQEQWRLVVTRPRTARSQAKQRRTGPEPRSRELAANSAHHHRTGPASLRKQADRIQSSSSEFVGGNANFTGWRMQPIGFEFSERLRKQADQLQRHRHWGSRYRNLDPARRISSAAAYTSARLAMAPSTKDSYLSRREHRPPGRTEPRGRCRVTRPAQCRRSRCPGGAQVGPRP